MKLQKIVDLCIFSAFAFVAVTPIHEFWHYWVARAFGATELSIGYSWLFNGWCQWHGGNHWLIYLSGGLFTGIIYLLVAWRALKTPTKWDESILFPFAMFGAVQVGYGIGETSLAFEATRQWFWHLAIAGALVFSIPVTIWRGPKLLNWILDSGRVNH